MRKCRKNNEFTNQSTKITLSLSSIFSENTSKSIFPMEHIIQLVFGNFVIKIHQILTKINTNRKFCQQIQGFLTLFDLGKEFDQMSSSERKERDEEKKDG